MKLSSRNLVVLRISAAALVAVIGFVYFRSGANLTLVNGSQEALSQVRVEVAGVSFNVGSLAPGETRKIKVRSYGDSNWDISGVWKNGDQLRAPVGYITSGSSFDDRVTIKRTGEPGYESEMWFFIPPLS